MPVGPPRRPLQPLNKEDKRALTETVKIMDSAIAKIDAETQ